MKVKDMIILLKTLPQNHNLLMSKDSEGNSFYNTSNEFSEEGKNIIMFPTHEAVYLEDEKGSSI